MITISEARILINENTQELKTQELNGSCDLSKFHGIDAMKGTVSAIELLKKGHDIWAAAYLGVLPYLRENIGADAVIVHDHGFEDAELKTCYANLDPLTAFITNDDVIYFTKDITLWGDKVQKSKTVRASSRFSAKFDKMKDKTFESKRRTTFLLCFDPQRNIIVESRVMDGDKVMKYLATSQDIKLGSFMSDGQKANTVLNNVIGWENWTNIIKPILKIKSIDYSKQN